MSGEMGITEFAANLALQGLVPALIRQPLRNLDDYMPNWKESGGMYRLLPAAGFRQPKVDVYGHPVEKTGNWFTPDVSAELGQAGGALAKGGCAPLATGITRTRGMCTRRARRLRLTWMEPGKRRG
jgi:hypothetical protein